MSQRDKLTFCQRDFFNIQSMTAHKNSMGWFKSMGQKLRRKIFGGQKFAEIFYRV
jgi:hypothetical protein